MGTVGFIPEFVGAMLNVADYTIFKAVPLGLGIIHTITHLLPPTSSNWTR